MRIYKNRTAASGKTKNPRRRTAGIRRKKVENRLTTMCRNAKEASDKTGKANRKSRIADVRADVRASRKNQILHKIGRRIELQNAIRGQNQAEMKKTGIMYQVSCIMPKIRKKE